jgi:hypothetical protein
VTQLQLGYDAVDFYSIPGSPLALMGYVDVHDEATGLSIYQSMRQRWPGAVVIPITTGGTHELTYDGKRVRVCDFEYLDLTAAGAAQWAAEEIQLGAPSWDPPTLYCQAANGAAAMSALSTVGLRMGIDVPWAMAWWNGRQDLLIPPPPWPKLPMPVCHQYASLYDEYDLWVGLPEWVSPSPPAPPKPKAKGVHMGLIFETNGTIYDGAVVLGANGKPATTAVALTKNGAAAYLAEVAAGNQPRPIPDVLNGLYNIYVVGNLGAAVQVSDLPGEDKSGLTGVPASPAPPASPAA